jgi:CheY-like chemotaxis protein
MERTHRIILIDDNRLDNVYHEWTLKSAGFGGEICIFETGEQALAALVDIDLNRRTVIFLDINMPGMDGFTVAEQLIPVLAGKPNVTLLMLTSSDAREDRERARGIESVRGYVTKPLTESVAKELLGAIEWDKIPASIAKSEYWL